MAQFYSMRSKIDEISQEFFQMTQEASNARETETHAALRIQSSYRGCVIRNRWHLLLYAANYIQRMMRGLIARKRVESVRIAKRRRLNQHFFNHCAAVIQKYFRGHWSRKHYHHYYRRKAYLKKVAERGAWTEEYLKREHSMNKEAQKEDEERATREEFDNLAGELHHLVSTQSIPGVYNPPYTDALPRAFDKPIEQHLRDSCRVQMPKALRRPKLRPLALSASPRMRLVDGSQKGMTMMPQDPSAPPQELPDRYPTRSRAASAGRLQKVQGPFRAKEQIEVANAKAANTFRSIQSSSPFEAVEDDARLQDRLAKLTRVAPKDFRAPSGAARPPPMPSSVHANTPYRDRPVELRNEAFELPKIRDKPPFFTALRTGKQFEDYGDGGLLPSGAV